MGLLKRITFEVPMPKAEFAFKLQQDIDPAGYGIFEAFSSNNKFLKGTVAGDTFELTRKRSVGYQNGVSYKGTFTAKGAGTEVQVETKLKWYFLLFFLFPILFIVQIFAIPVGNQQTAMTILPFAIIPIAFIFIMWFFVFRKIISGGEYMIQRELYFVSRKDNAADLSKHMVG